jgi:hypothetical protein
MIGETEIKRVNLARRESKRSLLPKRRSLGAVFCRRGALGVFFCRMELKGSAARACYCEPALHTRNVLYFAGFVWFIDIKP